MRILISKILPSEQLDLVKSWGWEFDVAPALEITPAEVLSLPAPSPVWIVSSRNSVAVAEKFKHEAPPDVLVVGTWMRDKLRTILSKSEIRPFANMKTLASYLRTQQIQTVLYFCADYHREDLEVGLRGSGIVIDKVVTHMSKPTTPDLHGAYDTVMAFSPRSIDSLLVFNKFDKSVLFACIGPTTEHYLHQLKYTNTFCASLPDSKVLLNELHAHLHTNI